MEPGYTLSRKAHGAVCKCGAAILVGDDNDTAGLEAKVDPRRLTRTGELLAVIAGRSVYEIDHGNRLYRRDRWMLRSTATATVLPSHTCHQPIPAHWTAPMPPARRPAAEMEF